MSNVNTPGTKTRQVPEQGRTPGLRYPQGCPLEEHQGYGCNCNPIPIRKTKQQFSG